MTVDLCPFAVVKLLPQDATQARITPRKIIAHTAVDGRNTTSLYDWFASPGAEGAESTWYVQETGGLEQYMRCSVKADAQFAGNVDGLSFESWDGGNPGTPWNAAQIATISRLLIWGRDALHIPIEILADPFGTGLGWHELFPSWNLDGHHCPGAEREAQFRQIITALNHPKPIPISPQEETMDTAINRQGRGEVFEVNDQGGLDHWWQAADGSYPKSAHESQAAPAVPGVKLEAVTAQDAPSSGPVGIRVFARDTKGGHWTKWQALDDHGAFAQWSGWKAFPG